MDDDMVKKIIIAEAIVSLIIIAFYITTFM
ncbi:Uncharacterised protein [uncultured archaeon]|nr:Uncharacterised protein [uncultured archaeon]